MDLHRFIHKGVALKFYGEKLNYSLSLGLFSSNDVDSGSRLLLKSLASELDFSNIGEAVDIGAGVGVLALAVKAKAPEARVTARDRDALALDFTGYNQQVNKIPKVDLEGALFLDNLGERRFDLILSNIPAKAGERVISHFLSQSVHYLRPGGRVAVVIVSPLKALAERVIGERSYPLLFQEHNSQYSVFHFRGTEESTYEPSAEDPGLSLYYRQKMFFEKERVRYQLTSVYNLPDFDEISWKDQLVMENLKGLQKGGRWLIMNPGQGHLLSFLVCRQVPKELTLVSRDLLQLRISEQNARDNGYTGPVNLLHLAREEAILNALGGDDFDFCHFDLNPVVRSSWEEPFRELTFKSAAPGAYISWLGKSAHIQPLQKSRKGTQSIADRKFRGWRSVILKINHR